MINKKTKKAFLRICIMIAILILPYFVFAQSSGETKNPLSRLETIGGEYGHYSEDTDKNTLFTIIGLVINIVLGLLSVAFLLLIIYAGYTWMTAQGNVDIVEKSKATLKQATIGLIITLSSWGIWELLSRLWLANL